MVGAPSGAMTSASAAALVSACTSLLMEILSFALRGLGWYPTLGSRRHRHIMGASPSGLTPARCWRHPRQGGRQAAEASMGSGGVPRAHPAPTGQPPRPPPPRAATVAELDPPRALTWLTLLSPSGRGATRDVQLPVPVPISLQQATACIGP